MFATVHAIVCLLYSSKIIYNQVLVECLYGRKPANFSRPKEYTACRHTRTGKF